MSVLKIDTTRLNYVIESRQDLQGKTSYVVICSLGKVRFRNLSSVFEFLEMNSNLGYIV